MKAQHFVGISGGQWQPTAQCDQCPEGWRSAMYYYRFQIRDASVTIMMGSKEVEKDLFAGSCNCISK